VPNILKVLNPLFLDDLRMKLKDAGDNARLLLNLRKRMSRIRVFDPACGSGNFLVIAYKEMRSIEAEINEKRKERGRKTEIPLTNFRGIEVRAFPAEIARLALIIAEYQCDVLYRGQQEALKDFLPLEPENWIICGNALRLDWVSICPSVGTAVKSHADDLFQSFDRAPVEFENAGGETYVCGNPPYLGSKWQNDEQKSDLCSVFEGHTNAWKSLDYVSGWFIKAALYGVKTNAVIAFVATNSICQGVQVSVLWPTLFATGHEIAFAHTSFRWSNLASHKAGVTVVIVALSRSPGASRRLLSIGDDGEVAERRVSYINAYLVPFANVLVEQSRAPISTVAPMLFGNMPRDGGNFTLTTDARSDLLRKHPELGRYIRPYLGSVEMIQGKRRSCIWIEDDEVAAARNHPYLESVLERVKAFRLKSVAQSTRDFAIRPHRFVQIAGVAKRYTLAIAKVSSERRPYIPVDILPGDAIVSDLLFAMYDAPLWNFSLIASRLHLVWIATICGKLETRYRYSNTLGWNTFPVPTLTENNKVDLTRCAEEILLARERHFPATIADLYDPEAMPLDLRDAHSKNDETLERIFVGRRFRNDTERLEKLFDMYTKLSSEQAPVKKITRKKSEAKT
jgi:N-6 DNA Methylase